MTRGLGFWLRRLPDFALGFLLATAIFAVALIFIVDPQTYHQICEANQYGGKESCTPHNVFYVVSWYAGRWFDASAAVITAIATGFIAWFTLTLRRATDRLWEAGERQLNHAERVAAESAANVVSSIVEAARAATAMEAISAGITENGRRQLRAYLAILPGAAIHQDVSKNIKFEIQPVIRNNGFTPAHNVIVRSKLVTETNPMPDDFDFSIEIIGEPSVMTIGSQQANFTVAVLDRFLTDEEIKEVMHPGARRLIVYGTVTYDDIFGDHWTTNFCNYVFWGDKGPAWFATRHHNDAT